VCFNSYQEAGASTPLTAGDRCRLEKIGGKQKRENWGKYFFFGAKLHSNAWYRMRQFCMQLLHFFVRFACKLLVASIFRAIFKGG